MLFTWTLGATEVVLLFLLYWPCGVFTVYHMGVLDLDLTTPWLHLWLVESCTQTGWVGRRVDLSLVWASYVQKSCLDCNNALTTSLFHGGLMMAGRVVFNCLPWWSSVGDGVLLSRGVALNSWRATWWLVPSSSHLLKSFLMIWTYLSMKPWHLG